jgi:hypothetical protein
MQTGMLMKSVYAMIDLGVDASAEKSRRMSLAGIDGILRTILSRGNLGERTRAGFFNQTLLYLYGD